MYLYLRNKNVPVFTYLTCVLSPLSGQFLFWTVAKRAVRYVKQRRTENAQMYVYLWDHVDLFTLILPQTCMLLFLFH